MNFTRATQRSAFSSRHSDSNALTSAIMREVNNDQNAAPSANSNGISLSAQVASNCQLQYFHIPDRGLKPGITRNASLQKPTPPRPNRIRSGSIGPRPRQASSGHQARSERGRTRPNRAISYRRYAKKTQSSKRNAVCRRRHTPSPPASRPHSETHRKSKPKVSSSTIQLACRTLCSEPGKSFAGLPNVRSKP